MRWLGRMDSGLRVQHEMHKAIALVTWLTFRISAQGWIPAASNSPTALVAHRLCSRVGKCFHLAIVPPCRHTDLAIENATP